MNMKRRWLILTFAVVSVLAIGIWGWIILGFTDESDQIVTEPSSSLTPSSDVDDGFQPFDALCEELDWSALEKAVGKIWTDVSSVQTGWSSHPSQSQACQASAPNQDKTFANVSVGIYSTAAQAISEYESSLLSSDGCSDGFQENLDANWSRSWMCVESNDTHGLMFYSVIAQLDNLVFRINVDIPSTPEIRTDEYTNGIEQESLLIGQQVQKLATSS